MKSKLTPLSLGPDVVHRLLPHRRPFLMVDSIEGYERAPRPSIRCARSISVNEPVFEGHFPGFHLWPGVYTIEACGQAANLLVILLGLQEAIERAGQDPELVLSALKNLELGYRLRPGFKPADASRDLEAIDRAMPDVASRMGMSAGVDVKLLAPVFAGQRLEISVERTHVMESLLRFEVEAVVEGKTVARGVMTSVCNITLPR